MSTTKPPPQDHAILEGLLYGLAAILSFAGIVLVVMIGG